MPQFSINSDREIFLRFLEHKNTFHRIHLLHIYTVTRRAHEIGNSNQAPREPPNQNRALKRLPRTEINNVVNKHVDATIPCPLVREYPRLKAPGVGPTLWEISVTTCPTTLGGRVDAINVKRNVDGNRD